MLLNSTRAWLVGVRAVLEIVQEVKPAFSNMSSRSLPDILTDNQFQL
jgi:hypothetical protein